MWMWKRHETKKLGFGRKQITNINVFTQDYASNIDSVLPDIYGIFYIVSGQSKTPWVKKLQLTLINIINNIKHYT